MPASYEDQRKLVQSLETRVQDFRNWQESAAKQVIRVQKKYNKFNSIACDETASNSERATARVNSFNTNGELQSAQNTRDGYPQCIRAEEARLKKARELFGKMKPPVPKKPTEVKPRAHPARSDPSKTARGRIGSSQLTGHKTAVYSKSHGAQEIRGRQQDVRRVIKTVAPVAKMERKKPVVNELGCDYKGMMRGQATQPGNAKGKKREREETPEEMSQPRRPIKRPRNDHVVRDDDDDELDDAARGEVPAVSTAKSAIPIKLSSKVTGAKRKASPSREEDSAAGSKRRRVDRQARKAVTSRKASAKPGLPATSSPEMSKRKSTSSESDKTQGSDTPASSVTSASASGKSSPGEKTTGKPFRGILNIHKSCFSSTVVQFLSAALEGEDLDHLLCQLAQTDNLGVTNKECRKTDRLFTRRDNSAMIKRARESARKYAKEDPDKISVAKYLRRLLENIHVDSEDPVSAFRLQTVVAEGGQDEEACKIRRVFGGHTDQDVLEFLTILMILLCEDPNTRDVDCLVGLFEIQTETVRYCPNPSCENKTMVPDESSCYYGVGVEENEKFQRAFQESKHSATDADCALCREKRVVDGGEVKEDETEGEAGTPKLKSITTFSNQPDNLIVSLGRCSYDGKQKKNTSTTNIQEHELNVGNTKYDLSAVIMHEGRSVDSGHYFIFRKHGEDCTHIDDKTVTKVSNEAVGDSDSSQSAMLLFKKQQS